MVLSKPIAMAFVIRDENMLTMMLKIKINTKKCKNIIVENCILYFVLAYAGIKLWVNAPSANILLNKFGSLKAIINISLYIFAPRTEAVNKSLKKPKILEIRIPALFVNICFSIL